jgi:hypothetical protein
VPPRNQPRELPAFLSPPRPRPDTRAAYYGGFEPVLLAERARDAKVPGRCALCPVPVAPGQRIARLPSGGGGIAHVACAARTAGVPR